MINTFVEIISKTSQKGMMTSKEIIQCSMYESKLYFWNIDGLSSVHEIEDSKMTKFIYKCILPSAI